MANACLHWYGKEPKPRRKVGHVTLTAATADDRDRLAAGWAGRFS